MASLGQADQHAAERYFASGQQHPGTDFTWGGGELIDAWPTSPRANEYDRMRTSQVETLVISGELDFETPPEVATKELLPYLPNGRQVVLEGFGHSTTFWTEQPEAGSRLINTFLDSGRVDDSLYTPQSVDFTPEGTQTALAKASRARWSASRS
jgi:pimeloyl-ACP methyl ester carboxylesterase